jgi:hypothetical protein
MATRIELVIDEIVLHGFDPLHGHSIGDAVQRHLHQLVAERAHAFRGHTSSETPRADAGAFAASRTGPADATGAGVARAVVGAIEGIRK